MANPLPPRRGPEPAKPKPRLPVMDDQASGAAARPIGKVKLQDFDQTTAPPPAPNAADPGTPVNKASRAVNPKRQYPLHFDLLMRDLFNRGEVPEHWQVIAADEVRLDEMNWDVEFALMDSRTNAVLHRRIEVQAGKLSRVSDR